MSNRWLGIKVEGSEIICVGLDFDGSQMNVIRERKISLQSGPRPQAYFQAYGRIIDLLGQHDFEKVAFASSAVNRQNSVSKGILEAAELRGVVQTAVIQANAQLQCFDMSVLKKSKNILGSDATSKYMDDDETWSKIISGKINKGSREAALVAIAACIQETTHP